MASGYAAGIARGLFDAILRPDRFVRSRTDEYAGGWIWLGYESVRLGVVYLLNLALYAIPLTLAGIGVQSTATPPSWFRDVVGAIVSPTTTWQFLVALLQNSAFLTIAAVLTFLTYHAAVLLTLSSRGVLQTAHTVTYSTSAYLAGMFSLVWYLSQSSATETAAAFVVALQKAFVYYFIDRLGSDLALPTGRPTHVELGTVSLEGQIVLTALVVCVLYYLYSMYLGARLNHGVSRFTGLIVVLAVTASPAIYVVGTILAYALGIALVT